MHRRLFGAIFVLSALAVTTGCQRLNYTKTFRLESMTVQELQFDPPAYEQKVKVTVTPTGGAVSGYLVKTSDARAVDRALQANKEPAASLLLGSRVSKEIAESYSFEATVPPKTEYTLLLKVGKKPSDVTVHVVGR